MITAQGGTGPTTNNKRVKLWFNATISGSSVTAGTVIADTGPWVNGTMPNNNVGWQLITNIFKYGDAGANTSTHRVRRSSVESMAGSALRYS